MRLKTILLALVVVAVLGWWSTSFAQTPYTYTCSWTQDGVNVESYTILVDGTAVVTGITASACTGTGAARTCTSPLTMTQNVSHTVIIRALGEFGQADSGPFSAAPPTAAAAVTVKK